MKSTVRALLIVAALLAPASASASGPTFCVPSPGPGCTNHNPLTVQAGLTHAMNVGVDATVKIAPGTYSCPTGGFRVDAPNALITVIGAGTAQTTLTCSPNFDVSSPEIGVIRADGTVSIRALSIHVPSGAGDFGDGHVGLWLSGATAQNVSINSDSAAITPVGAVLDPGTLLNSRIILPSNLNDSAVHAFVGSTIDHLTASTGGDVIFAENTTISHANLTGPWDVSADAGTVTLYDSVLYVTNGGPISGLYGLLAQNPNNGPETPTIIGHNLTIVGGGSGSVGAAAFANFTGQVAGVTLTDSVISGPQTAISRSATLGQANLSMSYDNYAAGNYAGSGPGTTVESHILHAAPGFVNPGPGLFSLRGSSALINAGTPGPLAAGVPPTDLAGKPRILTARGRCVARRDIGAYEFVPNVLPARATSPDTTVGTGHTVHLNGTGCSIDPRLTAHFSWSFGDGGTATGRHVTHRFHHPGTHHVILTVSDSAGRHGHASLTITVH